MRATPFILLIAACGGDPPRIASPTPARSQAPAPLPAPVGAKWVFVTPESGVNDKLDLGDGAALYVGDLGRREIVAGGKATNARTLAPDTLVGVRKDAEGRFVFVTDEGAVYVAREPLGDFIEVRKGPTSGRGVTILQQAIGGSAIVAVLSDARVVRTSDWGLTWKDVAYAGADPPFGHPASVAIARDGHGVLVHLPQRVFVTSDDGATWSPISGPASGARHAMIDGDGRIFVQGFRGRLSKLDVGALVATDEQPRDLATPLAPPEPHQDASTVRLIAGDHAVELETRPQKNGPNEVWVRSSKLGVTPGHATAVPALATRGSLERRVSAYGPHLLMLRSDAVDENTPTSTLMRSDDYGASWTADVTLEGDSPPPRERLLVAAGPRGWTYLGALCSTHTDADERDCVRRKIRLPGGKFEDLVSTEDIGVPTSFAFDEHHDKVYILADQTGGRMAVFESRLSENKLQRLPLEIHDRGWLPPVMSVDDAGTLHVITFDPGDVFAYVIQRRDAAGKELPTLYLPLASFATAGSVSPMVFAGPRGVLFAGTSSGWETDDAGETWSRVAADGAGTAQCAEGGCLVGEAQRIGWDLPGRKGDTERLVATPERPEKTAAAPGTRRDAEPKPAPALSLSCQASGTSGSVSRVPDFDRTSGPAWFEVEGEGDKATVVAGSRTDIRRMPLLGPTAFPRAKEHVVASRWLDGAIVAGRYAYDAGGPIDLEIGWFSLETGRVHHGLLPKLDPFRVAAAPHWTGDVSIVRGGLLYQSTDTAPLFFVHDDGKIERMTLPAHATVASAGRLGTAWLLYDGDADGTAQFSWSTDAGRTWSQRAWAIGDRETSSHLFPGDPPWLGVKDPIGGIGIFPVSLPLPEDPPLPKRIELDADVDHACDAHAALSQAFTLGGDVSAVHATLGKETLVARDRVAHVAPGGSLCTTGYVFRNATGDASMLVSREGSAWSGWVFHTKDHATRAEPVTCK